MEPKLAETAAVADRAVGAIDTLKTRVVLEQEVGAICCPNVRGSSLAHAISPQELKTGVAKTDTNNVFGGGRSVYRVRCAQHK